MKRILEQLFEHKQLSYETAKETLTNIGQGKYNQSQIAAFLTVYLMRSISLNELAGFRDALLDLCVKIDYRIITPLIYAEPVGMEKTPSIFPPCPLLL
jgi:anthranilate phosphoribosyltransferase